MLRWSDDDLGYRVGENRQPKRSNNIVINHYEIVYGFDEFLHYDNFVRLMLFHKFMNIKDVSSTNINIT